MCVCVRVDHELLHFWNQIGVEVSTVFPIERLLDTVALASHSIMTLASHSIMTLVLLPACPLTLGTSLLFIACLPCQQEHSL